MTGESGDRDNLMACCCAPIGADTVVYLALLPPGTVEPNGEFLRDRQLKNWGQML